MLYSSRLLDWSDKTMCYKFKANPQETTSTRHYTGEAINEIDPSFSTSQNDIPAKVIKACKQSLSKAFTLTWKDSYNKSSIPQCFKNQFIAPIYKKARKLDPGYYRPISLTSHAIKIFEKVMRKNLVHYLEDNNLLSNNQHGFRKGRRCLT